MKDDHIPIRELRKDLEPYKGTRSIPFKTVNQENCIRINDMVIFNKRLFVGTDKGLYEYDDERDVLRPVILQDN